MTYVATNSTATSSWKITMDLLAQKKIELAPFLSLKAPCGTGAAPLTP